MNRRQMMLMTGALATSAVAGMGLGSPQAYGERTSDGSVPLFDPRHYGAVGDGKALDSKAINAAIDACAKAGGGLVYLRPGTYRSGTIILKSNVTLYLEAGSVILGSADINDYGSVGHSIQLSGHSPKHLIYAQDAENVTLAGPGRIDGQGPAYWEPSQEGNLYVRHGWGAAASLDLQAKPTGRPTPMIQFVRCRWLRLEDIRIENSPGWTLNGLNCDNVHIQNITIKNPIYGRNADGIDLDGCQNVFIANCSIEAGDDAIVFKSEDPTRQGPRLTRNIVVTNCVLNTCCNAFKIGSGSQGGFENITFSNSVIYSNPGDYKNRVLSGVALEVVDGGWIEGVVVTGIQMQRARNPLFIRIGDRSAPHKTPRHGLRGVTIENIHASESIIPSSITGLPEALVSDVTLSNIHIENVLPSRPEWLNRAVPEAPHKYPESIMFGMLPCSGLYARHVRDLNLRNLSFRTSAGEARPTMIFDSVSGARVSALKSDKVAGNLPVLQLSNVADTWISDSAAPPSTSQYIGVSGSASKGIVVSGCDLRNAGKAIGTADEVPQNAVAVSGNITRNNQAES